MSEINVAFPFHLDGRGRMAEAGEEAHIQQLIEQLLFTERGERVNRPDFGAGLLDLVFSSLSDEEVTATEYLVRGSLQRWLGDRIEIDAVRVSEQDNVIYVRVVYRLAEQEEQRAATFRCQRRPWQS